MPQTGSVQSSLVVPPTYYNSRFKVRGSTNMDRFGQAVGDASVRWGTGLGFVDWAIGQVRKDIEDWVEEKAPIIKWRHPVKAVKKIARRQLRNFAWGIIKGAAGRKDIEAWRALPVQERIFERVPDDELAVWEGKLERLRVYEGAQFDDATKREVLNWLRDPHGNPDLYEAFLRRHARGTFDDQLLELVESRVRRPFGIGEDPLRRELTEIISKGEEITPELFARLENLKDMGVINQDVFEFLERLHLRQQFFNGLRNDLGWIEAFYTGRWKRKLFWQAPKKRLLGEPAGLRAAKEAQRRARKQVLQKAAHAAARGVKKVSSKAKVAVAKLLKKAAVTAAWQSFKAAVKTAVNTVVGALGGMAGAILGALTQAPTKVTKWTLELIACSCGCLALVFLGIIAVIVLVVGGAFNSSGTGGAPGAPVSIVQVQKTVDKTHFDVGVGARDPNERIVHFTITVKNLSDQEITDGKIVSEFDTTLFNPSARGHGTYDPAAGTLTWEGFSIPGGQTYEVRYDGFVDTASDQVIVDKATFSGMVAGTTVEGAVTATVVVGTGGTGLYPSGWPLARGCITQGPGGAHSHSGLEALDIAPVNVLDIIFDDLAVYATHDGRAYAGRNRTYGYYVAVVSPLGLKTTYGHLNGGSIAITNGQQVYPGTYLGTVYKGIMGFSTGTHLHYQVDGSGLKMEPPNIPTAVKRGCSGRGDCNLCFGR